MKRKKLLRRTFSSIILINLASLLLVTWFATYSFRIFYLAQTQEHLENSILTIQPEITELLDKGDWQAVDRFCKSIPSRNRITVILANGLVAGDSIAEPSKMESHHDRPEFREAVNSGKGQSIRFSETLGRRMVYFALNLSDRSENPAIIRMARPIDTIDATLNSIRNKAALSWLVMSTLVVIIMINFARLITRPFELLRENAKRFSGGQFEGPLPLPQWEEIGGLVEALNKMASRLDEHAKMLHKQKTEVDAVFASMKEAVLAVDSESYILTLNRAMCALFRIHPERSLHREVQEVIRNRELNAFVAQTLSQEGSVEADLAFYSPEQRFLLAHGTRLRDAAGQAVGAVIVLNDITQIKHLENVRRDFVANVSHELRTPITAIRGFVETLSAYDRHKPEDMARFIEIIGRQAERLGNIIQDLLSLSKIELGRETLRLELEERLLRPPLENAVKTCLEKAGEKQVPLILECPETLKARIHPNLFEQAVFNLLDNAVKYSDSGKRVCVRARESENGEVSIDVIDQGLGIAQNHLSRVFERFYRVDKARSRELGGTGLGLSIVHFIVKAHNGRVTARSELGRGSTFSIYIPHNRDGK